MRLITSTGFTVLEMPATAPVPNSTSSQNGPALTDKQKEQNPSWTTSRDVASADDDPVFADYTFSDDETRDDHGRWSSSGSGGLTSDAKPGSPISADDRAKIDTVHSLLDAGARKSADISDSNPHGKGMVGLYDKSGEQQYAKGAHFDQAVAERGGKQSGKNGGPLTASGEAFAERVGKLELAVTGLAKMVFEK
jgi:hypothetical protein